MKIITTETGSVYEYDEANNKVRRVNDTRLMRGDGQWQTLLIPSAPQEGMCWASFWKLDLPEGPVVTLRTTSTVVSIEEKVDA